MLLKLNLSDPRIVEIAALSGVDGVMLCTEHVPNDWINLENQIRAARLHNIDTLVRVERGSYSDCIRPMEAGATGIIVPHVETDAEARQVVEWVRFRPIGNRGLDGGNVDGLFGHLPLTEYITTANTDRIIVLQVESPEGLENLEKIAAVPGYDGICFGPGDFSHRIGKAGQLESPEVVAASQRVGAAARLHGKFAMAACLISPFPDMVSSGYRVFLLGADVVALSENIRQRVEMMRSRAQDLMGDSAPIAVHQLAPSAVRKHASV